MSDNTSYWYSEFATSSSSIGSLPTQALSSKEKTENWKRATMDSFERIGLTQLRENLKFKDFYRMVEGKMSYSELSEVIPQLRDLEEKLDTLDIPTFIKHYDLIGIIVNAMVGEYMQNSDKFNVTNIDEISTTEFERDKQDLVTKYISEEFQRELNLRLVRLGLNPNVESMGFQTPEEKEQYIQQLMQTRNEMTPPEIEVWMNTKWRTKASIWAEYTLEADKERFYLDELDRKELIDFLLTGRCFRHFRVGYDYYKPESWSPLNTFFSQDLDTKYVQDGEYVGRIHFYTPSQVVNKYGHLLTKAQKDKLLKGDNYTESYNKSPNFSSYKNLFEKHFAETHIVSHSQYYDYNLMLGIQDEFGIPLGEKTMLNKDGSERTFQTFLPSNKNNYGINNIANELRDDINLRSDLLQVTEVYWVSYKKIGYLTFETPDGRLTQEIVTDDILTDFLKENDIKQISTTTLHEVEDKPKANTIVWDYIPEVWQGIKVSDKNSQIGESLYINVEPTEFQIKGDSNVYEVKLPVAGIIDTSLALKMQPFQIGHNVAMNQMYNLVEKEIGLFYIFDINFLPSEYKEWGDTEDTLLHLRNIIKDTGLFPVDSSKQNVRDAGGFNQFAAQNLSFSGQINDRMALSEFYKNKTFEQVGFNLQRLGTPTSYTTAEGVKQSQNASYAQTEIYFEKFSDYKKRALELHLNIAQYAQKEGKDITVFYTKSDSSKAYLKFSDPYFQLRKLGLLPISNSKKRKELENFKSYLLNTNTLGSDEMALAQLFTSDTMVELIESSRMERMRRDQNTQQERDYQLQLLDKQQELEEQKEVSSWQRLEFSKEKDRQNKIEVERIDALGRAADNDADSTALNYINNEANIALQREKHNSDVELTNKDLESKNEKNRLDHQYKMENLKVQVRKMEADLKKSQDENYRSTINKN